MRCFNLCPESLDAKTGQLASLLGGDGRGWTERGGEGANHCAAVTR